MEIGKFVNSFLDSLEYIELPEHYGDLIDRDAVNERFYDICKEAYACPCQPSDKYLLDKLSMCVDTAPTILEATEVEE